MNECLLAVKEETQISKSTRGKPVDGGSQRSSSAKSTKARKSSAMAPSTEADIGSGARVDTKRPARTKKTPRKQRPSSAKEKAVPDKPTQGKTASAKRHNIELGQRGEEAATRFLDRHGYEIVERNWTCIAGEADIIARDEDALVFVEVKTRSNVDKGFPAEAVGAEKRRRYERIAALFLQNYDVVDVPVRFDVVSIIVVAPDRALIRHHINAFAGG